MTSQFNTATENLASPSLSTSSQNRPANVKESNSGKSPVSSAAVPITIYRELVAELQHTQKRLREVSDRNEHLAEQNQQLRHEVEQMIHAALHLRSVANEIQPDAPILPYLLSQDDQGPQGSGERLTTMPGGSIDSQQPTNAINTHDASSGSTSPELDHVLAAAIARQIPKTSQNEASSNPPSKPSTSADEQRSVSIETPDGKMKLQLPTLHQTVAVDPNKPSHGKGDRTSKTKHSGGWWLTVIVIFVMLSAFGAGFLAMLLVQNQRGASQGN